MLQLAGFFFFKPSAATHIQCDTDKVRTIWQMKFTSEFKCKRYYYWNTVPHCTAIYAAHLPEQQTRNSHQH